MALWTVEVIVRKIIERDLQAQIIMYLNLTLGGIKLVFNLPVATAGPGQLCLEGEDEVVKSPGDDDDVVHVQPVTHYDGCVADT